LKEKRIIKIIENKVIEQILHFVYFGYNMGLVKDHFVTKYYTGPQTWRLL
jgi:hypothetical protein